MATNGKNHKYEDGKVVRFPKPTQKKKSGSKEPFFNFGHIPPFTKALCLALAAIHALIFLLLDAGHTYALFYNFGFVPANFTNSINFTLLSLITPITSQFLHGSIMHLALNCVMLIAIGLYVERQFGARRMVLVFLITGIAGNIAYLILSPFETLPSIGASGGINGLMAITFLHMQWRGLMGPVLQEKGPLPFILLWISIILFTGLLSADISWQSHLGGFLAGVGLFTLWRKGIIR